MKKYVYIGLLVLVILVVAIATGNKYIIKDTVEEIVIEDPVKEVIAENAIIGVTSSDLETVILQVEGMTCRSCALGVESELKQVKGVVDAKISYDEGLVTVIFDPTQVNPETIAKASTAYPASVIR